MKNKNIIFILIITHFVCYVAAKNDLELSCSKSNICDMHASCQMIEGHSICVCNSGYEGDGIICTPTGECVADSNCGPNETCMYNETSFIYSCKCLEGYQKLENKCQRSRKTKLYILLTRKKQ